MKEKLFELMKQINQDCDIECEQRIKVFLRKLGAKQVQVSVYHVFESCGLDIYSVSAAWLEGGEVHLAVGSINLY